MTSTSLDSALQQLEVDATPFHTLHASSGWTGLMPHDKPLTVVVALQGQGELSLGQADTLQLGHGCVAVVPGPSPRVRDVGVAGSAALLLACGGVTAALRDGRALFADGVPVCIDIARTDLLRAVAGELLLESASTLAGAGGIVECIVKRLMTAVLRQSRTTGLLAPRHGERLARAAERMLKEPARAHPVESLAGTAGMSRTAFHHAFQRAYGASPNAFLKALRLRRAEVLLRSTDQPIKAIAAQLGYRSRSHFWLAFKTAYGLDPSSYRQQSADCGQSGR